MGLTRIDAEVKACQDIYRRLSRISLYDESSYAAAKLARHYERCATSITVPLEVYVRDIISCT